MPNEVREQVQERLLGIQVPVIQRDNVGRPVTNPAGDLIAGNAETGTDTIDIAHQITTVSPNRVFQQRKQAPATR